jgi:hypothetical protein
MLASVGLPEVYKTQALCAKSLSFSEGNCIDRKSVNNIDFLITLFLQDF